MCNPNSFNLITQSGLFVLEHSLHHRCIGCKILYRLSKGKKYKHFMLMFKGRIDHVTIFTGLWGSLIFLMPQHMTTNDKWEVGVIQGAMHCPCMGNGQLWPANFPPPELIVSASAFFKQNLLFVNHHLCSLNGQLKRCGIINQIMWHLLQPCFEKRCNVFIFMGGNLNISYLFSDPRRKYHVKILAVSQAGDGYQTDQTVSTPGCLCKSYSLLFILKSLQFETECLFWNDDICLR